MAIFGFDLENEILVCVRNWELKTWILKPRFENADSWLLRNKLKLKLKYEVNPRFDTQIWKPGPDLRMKNQ